MAESTIELKVSGMTCAGCVRSVEKKLASLNGVGRAQVDLAAGKATVGFDPAVTGAAQMIAAVEQIGFGASRE